jgi:S1-C subfamily serine protease
MSSSIKLIKRGKNEVLTGDQTAQDKRTGRHNTREMMKTVKGLIAELQRRHQDEELGTSAFRKMRVTLPLIVLFILCVGTESNCQQLRDAFRKVEPAVVIARTEQKGLAPFPQQGMVSSNGLGSGVRISNDGKVLTATHLVQAADRTVVE